MENQTNVTCEELSESQVAFIRSFSWWMETFFYLLVGMVGLMLNLIAMWILLTPTLWNNIFNRLLMFLAAIDSAFIVCGILEIFRKWMEWSIQQYLFVKFLYPFRSMAMCCSIYATVVLTLERYQAITSPIQHKHRGTSVTLGKRLLIYVLPVMFFSFAYYIPKFFDLDVKEVTKCQANASNITTLDTIASSNCTATHVIYPTHLRTDPNYILWYINTSNLVVTCLVPIGLLIFMNCRIGSSLNKFLQRRPSSMHADGSAKSKTGAQQNKTNSDIKKTFMLFSIVILFVVCHALRIMMNITELVNLERINLERQRGCDGTRFWQYVCMSLSEFLLIFNSSANFFVYMFFDKVFQEILRKRLCSMKSYFHLPTSFTTGFTTSTHLETETRPMPQLRVSVPVPRENATRAIDIELHTMNSKATSNETELPTV